MPESERAPSGTSAGAAQRVGVGAGSGYASGTRGLPPVYDEEREEGGGELGWGVRDGGSHRWALR